MWYRLLADLVVLGHLVFIIFGLMGGLLLLWRPRLVLLHLAVAGWMIVLALRSWDCPLTGLENSLRQQAGAHGYPGGFVEHYLIPVIYPPGLSSDTQWLLGLLALGVNLIIYTTIILWLRRRSGAENTGKP